MFVKEMIVKGKSVKGRILGGWTHNSYHAFNISELTSPSSSTSLTFTTNDLDALIEELTNVRDMVAKMNEDRLNEA